jgi:outer membrane protein OmpA-like peptidoglycan-associated protein
MIEQSSQHHLPELSHSLRRVISPAIAQEIEENQDKMVDALYPIMGGMVSKYVSQSIKEMIDRINEKIEDGLTFGKYKRKLKSKVTGVSEVELLVEESTQATITALMAIHKESGLLVAEAHLEEKELGDAHMVASMASAIKDFINDWIQSHQGQVSEVETLSYGQASLYIESAGSVYIVAFLDAEPDREQRSRINAFFARLIKKYRRFFQNFDGNDAAIEVQEITAKMQDFLRQHVSKKQSAQPRKRSRLVRYLWLALLLLVAGYLLYLLSEYYREYRVENLLWSKTGQKIEIKRENERYHLEGNVASLKAHHAVIKIARKELPMPLIDEMHLPLDKMEQTVTRVMNKVQIHLNSNTSLLKENIATVKNKLHKQVSERDQALQKEISQQKSMFTTRYDTLAEIVEKHETRLESWQEIMKSHDDNLSQAMVQVLQSMQALQGRIRVLEKEQGIAHQRIEHYKQSHATIRETAQLETYLMRRLANAFGNVNGFNSQDGSLDFKNSRLFAPGQASVTPGARKWLDTYFQRYIRLLLADTKIQPYLKNIVIEGYTDSTGTPKLNRTLSLERAQVVRDYILRSPWGKDKKLKTLLVARGLGSTSLILKEGVEDKDASRRIRVKFDLETRKIIHTILKVAK